MEKLDQLPQPEQPDRSGVSILVGENGLKMLVDWDQEECRLLLPELPDRYKQALEELPW